VLVFKLKVLAVAAAMVLATFAVPAPASAENVYATCKPPSDSRFTLEGWAFYIPWTPGTHNWFEYQFRLFGPAGDQSNVEIRLYENDQKKFEWISGDNIHIVIPYRVRPPEGTVLSASSTEQAWFQARFDKLFARDPTCLASTPVV
jgi:hypothetical protein